MANNKNITYDQLQATLNRIKTELDKKANSSHGTHLTLGTGSGNAYRGDYGNTAYQHSQATHAPSNAQKNSDITKAEIENKLTGTITTHTHNYITASDLNAKGYATQSYVDDNEIITTFYGTSTSAAADSVKIITVDDPKFTLRAGTIIAYKPSVSNSASNVKLNVNGTGAYPIWYSTSEYTSSSTTPTGTKDAHNFYMFSGTHWVWISRSNYITYSPASLGFGYGVCSTAEATVAKAVTISSYTLTTGGIVVIKFTNAVPANATLNIRTRGAKKIFYKGSAITDGVIKAGDTVTLIYDGTQYQVIHIEKATEVKDYITLRDQTTGWQYMLYIDNGELITSPKPVDVALATAPSKTSYNTGDAVDIYDIVIRVVYSNNYVQEVYADEVQYEPHYIQADTTHITITYPMIGDDFVEKIAITNTPFNPSTVLRDFYYTDNNNGTYTITGWKGTNNGVTSSYMIVPDNEKIIFG